MKIYYISDIHLDFYIEPNKHPSKIYKFLDSLIDKEKDYTNDVFVLAGDISHYNTQIIEILKYFSFKFRAVLFVSGNHEYYNVSKNQRYKYLHLHSKMNELKELLKSANLSNTYFLNGDTVEIDGIKFGGAMGWHSKEYIDRKREEDERHIHNNYQDFWYSTMNDSRLIPELSHPDLLYTEEIIKINSLLKQDIDVLITHYLPIIEENIFDEMYRYELSNTFYCFDALKDILNSKVKLNIHGHSHNKLSLDIEDVKFVRNPLGYPSESKGRNIKIQLIEI